MRPSRDTAALRRSAPWFLAAIFLAGAAHAQPPPAAPPAASNAPKPLSASLTGMAKAEYEGGKILFQDGDPKSALVKFQHAFELSGDPRLLWNIAACEKGLRRYAKVLGTLDRYLKEGGPLLTEEDRRDADEVIRTVKTLVSNVKILVSEEGAEVFVDEQKVGTSPLGAVLVDVGDRRIKVKKAGFKPFEKPVQIVGATDLTVVAKLEREVHRGNLIVQAGKNDFISLDGKMVGLGRWEGPVPSGGHTLRVTAQGMVPYQSEVVVQDDATRTIQVTLNPQAKSGNSYTWLWIAGGALLVTGAAVGGAFLFKPAEAQRTTGTLDTVPITLGGKR